MDRDRVGGEGVESQDVEPGSFALQEEAGVADGDPRIGRAVTQRREVLARKTHDHGVDLVDAHLVARTGIAGERSGAEPHHADGDRRRPADKCREQLAVGSLDRIVGGSALDRAVGPLPLRAVQRGPVMEGAYAGGLGNPIDPEEGALSRDLNVGLGRDRSRREKDNEQGAREQQRLRPQDEQRRRCENDDRERDHGQYQGALAETAEPGKCDREPGDDEGEGDAGDDEMDPAQREGRSRHQGRDESEDDGVLVDVDEDDRGDEGDQKPADQPAGRDQEVEAGEVGGRWAQAGEGAVAAECRQGEDEQVNEAEREDRAAHRIDDREEDERQRQHARKDTRRHPAGAARRRGRRCRDRARAARSRGAALPPRRWSGIA